MHFNNNTEKLLDRKFAKAPGQQEYHTFKSFITFASLCCLGYAAWNAVF
jgi:Golgi nucleoside diphosphatase